MQVEYAHKMTEQEVISFFESIRTKQRYTIAQCESAIRENEKLLLDAYKKYDADLIKDYDRIYEERSLARNCIIKNICQCGSPVKEVRGHFGSFLGCSDYYNKSKNHKVWNFIPSYESDLCKNWLTQILDRCKLRSVINAKALYYFYNEQGLTDLQQYYTGKSTFEILDRFNKVKTRASKFEDSQYIRLKYIHLNAQQQFPIKYKMVGDKEKHCFIDILCSDPDDVYIYECKTNNLSKDSEQEKLYTLLINHINSTLKINKTVHFKYLIEDND